MANRGPFSMLFALGVAGASLASAQNLLPNPEFNSSDASWDNLNIAGAIDWNASDSRSCPGSGSVVVPCNGLTRVVSECLLYSPQASWGEFDLKSTITLETIVDVRLRIDVYADTECTVETVHAESLLEDAFAETTWDHHEFFIASFSPFMQSIRVRMEVESGHCGIMSGEELFFDSAYFGPADRIFAHDFENGDFCPFDQTP